MGHRTGRCAARERWLPELRRLDSQSTQHPALPLRTRTPIYTTCLSCHGDLGRNETVELFPVGRRLAFDAAKGRLWVVCPRCAHWNLSPLEERWEAIEVCERAYRDTKDRVATGEIGMAKVREGLSLVRIGSPIFPEYAAWRYHRRFAARYARSVAIGAGAGIAAGALFLAIGPLSGGVFSGFTAWYAGKGCYEFLRSRGIGRLRRDDYGDAKTMDDTWVEIGRGDLDNISIVGVGANKRYDGPERWTVRISKPGAPAWYLRPSDAPGVLRRVMPGVNVAGQSEEDVGLGVELYEQWSGDVLGQLEHLVNSHSGPVKLSEEPAVSIALEMSLAEAQERQWLETELYLLAAAWKEAEELAVVADSLTLPDWVTDRVEGLRRGGG